MMNRNYMQLQYYNHVIYSYNIYIYIALYYLYRYTLYKINRSFMPCFHYFMLMVFWSLVFVE